MQIWSAEIKELESLYTSIKRRFPELGKDLEHLIKTDDENVALLYSRRCLEIIITDLCECELKRPRKTEPLKGIIDKLYHEEKVPANIIASMHGINDLSTFGAHPKEFDPRQVKPVLNNLATIIEWYQKTKNINNGSGREKIKFERTVEHSNQFKNSIAVLPFVDMSSDKDQEYFCDGMTEEIINALTKIENLHVVARTSSFAFKGKNIDVREIGQKLGVETLLEGSVKISGNLVRVTAQLINIMNGYHLWSERFDRELNNIFEIQDEISLQIVNKLKISIEPHEENMLVKRYTNDLEAYNLYLKGRYHWNKLTEEGFNTGMDFFRKAIQKDPDYALAYSGIADCYCRLGWYSYLSPKDSFPEAKEAAEKALKMDNNLAEAYTSLGFVSMCYDRDYPKAEKEFKQAIYLNPGYAWSHSCYSIYLAIVGKHDESITEGKIALQLDPLTPMMLINLGMRYYYARKFQQAIVYIKKAIELDPGFEIAHFYLAWASMQMKKYDEASDEIQNAIKYFGRKNPEILSALGIILTLISQKNQAEKVVNEMFELAKEKYISPFWMTVLFFVLNRKELAFEWLEKSYKVHDCLMIFLNADPVFDPFKSDPKFQDMLKKMNLI